MVDQYLPHLIKSVVEKVSAVMLTKPEPFQVSYFYGNYQDIAKELSRKRLKDEDDFYPLVCLLMPYQIRKPDMGEPTALFDLLIIHDTKSEYLMPQREELIFFPRLLPVYEEILRQIRKDGKAFTTTAGIDHTEVIRPYWGGNESGNADAKNLFDDYVDAVQMKDMKLVIKGSNIC